MVLDPAEERIKSEFAGVKRTYPADAFGAADRRSEEAGRKQVTPFEGGNVAQFPVPLFSPHRPGK